MSTMKVHRYCSSDFLFNKVSTVEIDSRVSHLNVITSRSSAEIVSR